MRLHAPARIVAERVPPTVGVLDAVDDATCILTTGSYSLDSLAAHLALIGVDFQILEPPELIDHVRAMAEKLARATRPRQDDS